MKRNSTQSARSSGGWRVIGQSASRSVIENRAAEYAGLGYETRIKSGRNARDGAYYRLFVKKRKNPGRRTVTAVATRTIRKGQSFKIRL